MDNQAEKLNIERNRAQLRIRITEGVRQLGVCPWKNIFVAMLLAILAKPFSFILNNRTLPFESLIPSQFFWVYDGIKIVLIVIAFLMPLWGLIHFIGIPSMDRKINKCLMAKFSTEDFQNAYCPILMSSRRIKGTNMVRLEFFSPYLSLGIWQATQKRANIPAGWGYHLEGRLENGGRDGNDARKIVMFTAPGAKPVNRSAPIDPLFK